MLPSQQPAIVETVNPTSLRLSTAQNSQPCEQQQSVDQGHGDYSAGATGFGHGFGLQPAYTDSYSHTAGPSMHSSTPDPSIENATGATDRPGGQPQSTRRQQSAIPDTLHRKEWDNIPLFLQTALKDALVVSHTATFLRNLLLIIVGCHEIRLQQYARACVGSMQGVIRAMARW
jgi:hypothetical protein